MDDRNYDITNKVSEVLGDIKGFEVAMNNPRSGRMITKYNGVSFYISIDPIFNDNAAGRIEEGKPFEQIVREHTYVFR